MNGHLGPLVSALIDDQLTPAARERALAHVALCERCAEDLRDTKTARGIVNRAGGTPAIRADFIDGLLRLAPQPSSLINQPDIERDDHFVDHSQVPGGAYCGVVKSGSISKRWLRYGSVFVGGGLCAAAFLLGARPGVTPLNDSDLVAQRLFELRDQHAFNPLYEVTAPVQTGATPSIDTAKFETWLNAHGWTTPQNLPRDVRIKQAGFSAQRPSELEIVFETPLGDVLVIENRGILDATAVQNAQVMAHETGPVYALSQDPAHLVWQSGDTVIEVLSENKVDDLLAFAHSFEADQHDSGISARFVRGFTDLAGVVSE